LPVPSGGGYELFCRDYVLLGVLVQELAPFSELPGLIHAQDGDWFSAGVVHGQETALGNVAVLNFDPVVALSPASELDS
jgi:hypothetical protein